MGLTVDQAELIGASLQSVVYGVYLVLLGVTVYVLTFKARLRNRKVNKILLLGSLQLCCLISSHWIIDQSRLWSVFIQAQPDTDVAKSAGTDSEFVWERDGRNIARNVLLLLEILTIDSLMLYRVFVIWGQSWLVVLVPSLTLMAAMVTGGIGCAQLVTSSWSESLVLQLRRAVIVPFSLSLATNILALGLITYRIVRHNREVRPLGASGLYSVITILIEGAGLYCAVNLIAVIALIADPVLYLIIRDVASPITGISCCMIKIRGGFHDTAEASLKDGAATAPSCVTRNGVREVAPVEHMMDITRKYRTDYSGIAFERKAEAATRDSESHPWGCDA